MMSALGPTTDIRWKGRTFQFGSKADVRVTLCQARRKEICVFIINVSIEPHIFGRDYETITGGCYDFS
jgi:hypothetical protein